MLKRTLTLFVIIVSIASFAAAQVRSFSVPRPVDLDGMARNAFPDYYGKQEYEQLLNDDFYPIGWSRDGKFAYLVEPVDDACGCYFAELHIIDLRTDRSLWVYKNDPEKRVAKDGSYLPDNLKRFWKRNQALFSKKLSSYLIQPVPKVALLSSDFAWGGQKYALDLRTRKSPNEDFAIDVVTSAALALSSPDLGKKTVYTADKKDLGTYPPLDMAVAGVFRSPYENRIAVVLLNVQRGWEGPPHTAEVKIVGADLKNGFIR